MNGRSPSLLQRRVDGAPGAEGGGPDPDVSSELSEPRRWGYPSPAMRTHGEFTHTRGLVLLDAPLSSRAADESGCSWPQDPGRDASETYFLDITDRSSGYHLHLLVPLFVAYTCSIRTSRSARLSSMTLGSSRGAVNVRSVHDTGGLLRMMRSNSIGNADRYSLEESPANE